MRSDGSSPSQEGRPGDGRPWLAPAGLLLLGASIVLGLAFVLDARAPVWERILGFVVGSASMVGLVLLVRARLRERARKDARIRTLLDENERLSLAIEAGGVGIWEWDVLGDRLRIDEHIRALYRLPARSAEISYENWKRRVHPDDLERCEAVVSALLAGGRTLDIEYRVRLDDGTTRHIRAQGALRRDGAGRPLRMAGTSWDITEMKRAEEQERRRAQRVSELLQNTDQGIYGVDRDGLCTFVNRSGLELLGYGIEECLGKDMHALVHHSRAEGEEYPADDCPIHSATATGCSGRIETEVFWRKDGTSFPVEYSFAPVIEDGEIRGAVVTFADVAERRSEQAALLKSNRDLQEAIERAQVLAAQAEHANRAKGDFLANISHEIRTPMNGVMGMTSVLLGTRLSPEQRRFAEVIRGSGESLLALIDEILDFSKIEAGKLVLDPVEFDPRALVEELVAVHAPRVHAKGLEFVCAIGPDLPPVANGDSGRLRQILSNLVGNAVKFTERGRIVVRVETAARGDGDATLLFQVEDTGIGIPASKQDSLFQKFVQVDASTTRQYGGTGLGLAISRELVALMGGTIGLRSEPGGGSVFWFTVRFETPDASEWDPESEFAERLEGGRALVVDDDPVAREVLSGMLSSWGLRVEGVPDASAAFAALERGSLEGRPFDHVLIDARLPGVDGISLARAILGDARHASLEPVLLTSFAESRDVLRAEALPEVRQVAKPVRRSELLAVLAGESPEVESREEPMGATPRIAKPDGGRVRVLLAEDNLVNRTVATEILERMGVECVATPNGAEAVALLETADFDLVLMDVQMPVMDGLEATRAIRSGSRVRNRAIPIVAMTANAMRGDRERFLDAGMDDFVSKPVSPERLFEVVGDWSGVGSELRTGRRKMRRADEEAVLDWSDLLERVMGRADAACRVAEVFRDEMPAKLAELRRSIERSDAASVREIAHVLKGASGNLGARRLCRAAERLEVSALQGAVAGFDAHLRRIEHEMSRVLAAVEERSGLVAASPIAG